ncbi:MAG: RsmB/NOP family class I SAM-dependent RNA methyltransferase [Opitutae bacterium]|nr:RsmB/NOP family class I SAM-dependent RNA methyltransferase [Opitutae bacterium]
MSVASSQRHTFLQLLDQLRPQLRRDANFPARLQAALGQRRGIGSRDRRLYRELLYTTLRFLPWVEQQPEEQLVAMVAALAAETPATRAFRTAFADAKLLEGLPREALLPEWLRTECPEAFAPPQLDALLRRAPLWLRLQTDTPAPVLAEFDEFGWSWQRSDVLPSAIRLNTEADVTKTDAFNHGLIEVQDLGSQLLLETVGIAAGERWFDACAGAGGKTLQLARLLGPGGSVEAHDIRPAALAELAQRAQRACLRNVRVVPRPAGLYDGVLVDAPCSGSGTWRRAPHLKWTTTLASVAQAAAQQAAILARYAASVRPGGRLVYATCSLCRSENTAVLAAFLAAHPEFSPMRPARDFGFAAASGGLTVWPAAHDTDGFFVASLRRTD